MSAKETGGAAFPAGAVRKGRERPHDAGSDWVVTERIDPAQGGMTLRDYFAAKALQGMAANTDDSYTPDRETYEEYVAEFSRCAYQIADAMRQVLAIRASNQPQERRAA